MILCLVTFILLELLFDLIVALRGTIVVYLTSDLSDRSFLERNAKYSSVVVRHLARVVLQN